MGTGALTTVEALVHIHEMLEVIAVFVIARFGWDLYKALVGGWFRLDK